MILHETVAWYQKKIGTYDKQEWEKTVEQRILNGFVNVPLKNTKLKTELIDVDLVRGSSFPKAKPKQSLITVLRLAILRFILLPLYAKWWVKQTSPKVFSFLLFVYLIQMCNWGVYSFNINRLRSDSEHIVSIAELLVPVALSLILSVIHSQIVATASNVTKPENRRQPHLQPKRKKRERIKRRKRNTKVRSSSTETKSAPIISVDVKSSKEKLQSSTSTNNSYNKTSHKSYRNSIAITTPSTNLSTSSTSQHTPIATVLFTNNDEQENLANSDDNITIMKSKVIKSDNCTINQALIEESCNLRKRNVNWDSPIKSQVVLSNFDHYVYEIEDINTTVKKQQKVEISSEEIIYEYYSDLLDIVEDESKKINNDNNQNDNVHNISEQTGDDDGFESLNGKSSSGEENFIVRNERRSLMNAEDKIYRNVWANVAEENTLNSNLTDSDTDTLKGHSSSMISRKNSLSLSLTNTTKPLNLPFKSNTKQSSIPTTKVRQSSESELDFKNIQKAPNNSAIKLQKPFLNELSKDDSSDIDEENEDCETISTPGTNSNPQFTEGTTSAGEWIGVTTNSEECSYSSDIQSDTQNDYSENGMEYDFTPTVILNPTCGASDRISCTIWDCKETKKAEMSVLDISSAIIEKVEAMPETCDYIYIGLLFSITLSFIPGFCRLCEATMDSNSSTEMKFFDMPVLLLEKASFSSTRILLIAFGDKHWERFVLVVCLLLRVCLSFIFFFLLAVAERTFKQRFLYAKLFSHLTSSRRARKSDLPHFRLNKVRNIKTWLSVRSYLKRRGPQRSVEVIVSAAFILTLLLLAFLSVEWLKDSVHLHSQFNFEALMWSCALGIFLLRFMTLGTKINRKYRSISVLITEQINLYLQIEQKPNKKDELMVSNSVLKLAADLLKELESPFKISGLSANPYLYTTVKVVILSALSGVLSEILGFKLKLHKIKIK